MPIRKERLSLLLLLLWCFPLLSQAGTRPAVEHAPSSWSSGVYSYDGAGNIRAIGADTYVYDTAGRLVSGTADRQRSGIENRQDYGYDGFGNRISTTTLSPLRCAGNTDCSVNVDIDPQTNHIRGYTYDSAGNVERIDANHSYSYDGTGSLSQETFPGGSWQFVYTADGNRIATYGQGSWHWTLRQENGTVIREFTSVDAQGRYGTALWTWLKDYVYRGTKVLAAETPAGRWHFHLDHLGTPRLITGDEGETIAYHSYYPFGAELELLPREGVEEHLKFTGHERDTITGDVRTLDYMRARYASPFTGRFMSIDPVGGEPSRPQSWNRYTYVRNNPMLLTDYTGMTTGGIGGCAQGSSAGSYTPCPKVVETQLERRADPRQPDSDHARAVARQQEGGAAVQEMQRSASIRGQANIKSFTGQVEVNAAGEWTVTGRQQKNFAQGSVQKGPDGVITQFRIDLKGYAISVDSADRVEITTPAVAVRSDGLITVGRTAGGNGAVLRLNPVRFLGGLARGIGTIAGEIGEAMVAQFPVNQHEQYNLNDSRP